MRRLNLKYGKSEIPFEFDENRFQVLQAGDDAQPLSDIEIGARLDLPIDSLPLEDIVSPGESVLIAVPDATRQTAAGQVVNLVVRRLVANGIPPHDIRIIFATGIHRKVSEEERKSILTPFIVQRIKTLDHDPRDLLQIVHFGQTSGGIPIGLNRALTDHDHVIIVGGIAFHYFAGFTGGRKLVCPGLASTKTVTATHKLAFDCATRSRRSGVGTGSLEGNPVNEAFMDAVAKINPSFAISTIVNDRGQVVDLFCGNWITSHRKACDSYAAKHTIKLTEKRDLVIVSCGGYPYDINLIQSHKALEAASQACREGGTIVLLAECIDGLGRDDFLAWFKAENSGAIAEQLCENYRVNGQTAWSLLRKAETFNIRIVTALELDTVGAMRLNPVDRFSINDISTKKKEGYILPFGATFFPEP